MTDLIEVSNKQEEFNEDKKYGNNELFYDTRNLAEYYINQDVTGRVRLFINKFN